MKSTERKNKAVSEVIGTMFVFAIFITLLTTVIAWYIPATQTSAEQNFQSDTLSSMSGLTSTLSSPYLKTGSVINQNIPMGIKGSFFLPATQTSLTYSKQGFTGSMQYDIGLSFKYLNGHPTAGVLNKIVGSFPQQVILNASAEVYVPGTTPYVYIAGNSSDNVVVINAYTDQIVKYIYAGYNPVALAYDPLNGMLYVADYYAPSGGNSVISYINTATNAYVGNVSIGFAHPTEIAFGGYGGGSIYVASADSPDIAMISVSGSTPLLAPNPIRTGNFDHTGIQYYDGGTYPTIVLLNNRTKGNNLDSYSIYYASNLTQYNIIHLSFAQGSKLKIGILTGLAFNGPTMYISVNNASIGHGKKLKGFSGILSTVYDSQTVLEQPANITGLAVGLAYDPTTNQLGAVVHSNLSTDEVFSYLIASSNPLYMNVSGQINVSRVTSQIVLGQDSASTSNYFYVTSNGVNELDKVLVNSTSSNALYLAAVIHENYFENPVYAAYDPVNRYMYVANNESGTISVISTFTDQILGKIILDPASNPTQVAIDTSSGYVYVLESADSSVAVISNLTLIGILQLTYGNGGGNQSPVSPTGISFNAHTKTVFVTANYFGKISGKTTVTPLYYNISSLSSSPSPQPLSTTGEQFQAVSFDPYNNATYAVIWTNSTTSPYFELIDISTGSSTLTPLTLYQSTPTGNYTLAFDSYNGKMFAAFSTPGKYGYVQIFNGTSQALLSAKPWKVITTGGEPIGPVFDPGNNLVYIPNYAKVNPSGGTSGGTFAGSGSNVTIVSANTGTYVNTIWVGSGPQNACFDPDNGYIYIPDSGIDKVTVIDGGYTVFNGKVGIFVHNTLNYGGMITSSGQTNFVSPISYVMEGAYLIQNHTQSSSSVLEGTLPLVLTNNSGRLYLYASGLGISSGGTSSTQSVASISSTDLQLQVLKKVNTTYFIGSNFFVSDLYGNQYNAIVTNIYLENFVMNFNTPYASVLDKYLYQSYNGSSSSTPPNSWNFAGHNLPFHVSFDKAANSLTITEITGSTVSLSALTLLYYQIGINKM